MSKYIDVNERAHFNQWSETYDRSIEQWLFFDRVHRGVLARLPESLTPTAILDIGCGTGRLLHRLHVRWPSATLLGIDLSEGMLSHARQRLPYALICQAPAENLPLANSSVDLVTSTVSFHHWTDHILGVGEAARVLRTGGLFLLADMTLSWFGHTFSPSQVRRVFKSSGLVIRSQTTPVPFFTFSIGEKS